MEPQPTSAQEQHGMETDPQADQLQGLLDENDRPLTAEDPQSLVDAKQELFTHLSL